MKKANRVLAMFLAVIMAFSLCTVAFAEEECKTVTLLKSISQTGKFRADAAGIGHNGSYVAFPFTLYDDIKNNKICCDFTEKGIQVMATDSEIKVVIPKFICYLSLNSLSSALVTPLLAGVKTFQKIFADFVADPNLSAFNMTVTSEVHNNKQCTLEKFQGKIVGTAGSFYYDESGSLCDVILYDNGGEYVSVNLNSFSVDFDSSVMNVPFYYINLSLLFKLLSLFGVTLPI